MSEDTQKVLALKYRPKNFKELIGQDIMVETITNSIQLNKLPNAYLLTGIRGVGKTTTARLIAKALNCTKNFLKEERCDCNHCEEISSSKHLDVLEMDAASRTGIDDVRELIDSSKYNPTSAKYKIFIIDEVHMLSKQAFNGLLKTLEEPPPHLKFIFATTEVKKIPVTIISRCQRFDLHRVPIPILLENLKKISKKENGKISEAALRLIAKASEGSVRDSLSLLDRALVSYHILEKEIDDTAIRQMLGIADRSKILTTIKYIFQGDLKKSLENFRSLVDEGIDPTTFLNDFLEIIYFLLQEKNIGEINSDLSISESEAESIRLISKEVPSSTLVIFWQFILKGIEELSIVGNQILSLEMLIMKLIHLKGMPSFQEVLNTMDENKVNKTSDIPVDLNNKKSFDEKNNEASQKPKNQIKNTLQTKLKIESSLHKTTSNPDKEKISSFEDLVNLSSKKKEIELKYDLERNVNLIKFSEGKIDIEFNENLNKNFVRNLSEKLLEWTGRRWVISLAKDKGQKTFLEQKNIKKKEVLENEKNSEVHLKFKDVFSDLELIDVMKNKGD
tara:strand:- start:1017 stop:2702 length:1686 start_codon:yes stop_codon:yes gene_type:complete